MDASRIIAYLENSIFSSLLLDKDVTDISYNGENIHYMHNIKGRCKSEYKLGVNEANDFIKQIANMSEKQFSYNNPILDISFGKYRLNATHQAIARRNNEPTITFSIRIAGEDIKIKNNSTFFPLVIGELITTILKEKMSVVISGETGSGKTEFQKYLLSNLETNSRVIIIDSALELDINYGNNIDYSIWQSNNKNENISIQALVKNALRNNPDWIIVAESRGEEMIDILNSVMSGHPIIVTIHSKNVLSVPHRITRMVMMNKKDMAFEDVLSDVLSHFQVYFHLEREVRNDGSIVRRVASIAISNDKDIYPIYERKEGYQYFYPFSENIKSMFLRHPLSDEFKKCFIRSEKK